MNAILDNPIWSALNDENSHLGEGDDSVKLFYADVAPFAGLDSYTTENFKRLFEMVDPDQVVVLFSLETELEVSPFELVVKVPGYQMIFQGEVAESIEADDVVHLTEKDVPEMLTLTQLTEPGPFVERTIAFGGYRGIYHDGKLVAMAGQRLQGNGTVEISAVCTHPDYVGKGFARKIINELVRNIVASGNIAYLHVREDNIRAVDLYQRMGFVIREEIYFYVIKKANQASF